jgi:hypothetical protein
MRPRVPAPDPTTFKKAPHEERDKGKQGKLGL